MDENILQAVKDAAIGMLRDHEPDVDVYAEEIMRTGRWSRRMRIAVNGILWR